MSEKIKNKSCLRITEDDCLRLIYEKQAILQERLGRLAKARNTNMQGKSFMIIEETFHISRELGEMIDNLPFKHWRKYNNKELKTWKNEEQREKVMEEYIDALHFFLNIALILNFSPEEIFEKYMEKNKENHNRQDRGY